MEKQPMEAPPAYAEGQQPPLHPDPNPAGSVPGPPPPVVTTVVATPTHLPTSPPLATSPVAMQCPNCHTQITTEVTPVNGLLVWICIVLLCPICWLGCCLIPLCIDDLKDVEHRCPQCRAFIGLKRRLW